MSVASVHLGLEHVDIGLAHARLARVNILGQRGEDGAEVEEAVLHAAEDPGEAHELRAVGLALEGSEPRGANEGVELVDLAVAGDAGAGLGNDLPANERGGALVTLAGVDAVDGDALRRVEFLGHAQLRLGAARVAALSSDDSSGLRIRGRGQSRRRSSLSLLSRRGRWRRGWRPGA